VTRFEIKFFRERELACEIFQRLAQLRVTVLVNEVCRACASARCTSKSSARIAPLQRRVDSALITQRELVGLPARFLQPVREIRNLLFLASAIALYWYWLPTRDRRSRVSTRRCGRPSPASSIRCLSNARGEVSQLTLRYDATQQSWRGDVLRQQPQAARCCASDSLSGLRFSSQVSQQCGEL
jgi:hypothetical protein